MVCACSLRCSVTKWISYILHWKWCQNTKLAAKKHLQHVITESNQNYMIETQRNIEMSPSTGSTLAAKFNSFYSYWSQFHIYYTEKNINDIFREIPGEVLLQITLYYWCRKIRVYSYPRKIKRIYNGNTMFPDESTFTHCYVYGNFYVLELMVKFWRPIDPILQ